MFSGRYIPSDEATFYHSDRDNIKDLKQKVKLLEKKLELIEGHLKITYEDGMRIVDKENK